MSTHEYPKEMIDPGANTPAAPERLRSFVERMEWSGWGYDRAGEGKPKYPDCGSWQDEGHAEGCGLAALLAAPAVPAPAQPWLPIETAPQDGRTILLGRHNELGKWRTMRGQWMSQDCIDETWEDPESGEPGWFETCVEADEIPNCWPTNPTHWMPLPGAPEAA